MTRPGLTLVEVLASIVLLTGMAAVVVPLLQSGQSGPIEPANTRLSAAELELAVRDMLELQPLDAEALRSLLDGGNSVLEWTNDQRTREIVVSRVPDRTSELPIKAAPRNTESGAAPEHGFAETYMRLRFECGGAAVHRAVAHPVSEVNSAREQAE